MRRRQVHVQSLSVLPIQNPRARREYRTYGETVRIEGGGDHWFPQIAFSPPHLGLLTAWFVDAVMGSRPPPFLRILPLPLTWGRYLINQRVFHVTVPY